MALIRSLAMQYHRSVSERKYSLAQEHEMVLRYKAGDSSRQLARAFGGGPHTVLRMLRRLEVRVRPKSGHDARKVTANLVRHILQRYAQGESQHVIGRRFNLSQSRVSEIMARNGVQARYPRWKNGVTMRQGYRAIRLAYGDRFFDMTGSSPYVMEHRLIMAEHLGRSLRPDEDVHHINGKRDDNRLENLQLRVRKHGVGVAYKCADCGSHNVVPVRLSE